MCCLRLPSVFASSPPFAKAAAYVPYSTVRDLTSVRCVWCVCCVCVAVVVSWLLASRFPLSPCRTLLFPVAAPEGCLPLRVSSVVRRRCLRVCVAVWSARHFSRPLSSLSRSLFDGFRLVGPGDELAQPHVSSAVARRGRSSVGNRGPSLPPVTMKVPRRRCPHRSGYRDRLRSDDRPQLSCDSTSSHR